MNGISGMALGVLSSSDTLSTFIFSSTALKRSFDVEDAEDVPVSPPSSPSRSPLTPSPPGVILAAGNGDGRRAVGPIQPSYQSRISLSSSPSPAHSPVLKTRISSSLSFNRGTIHLPRANGTSLTRVSSFQTRLNPNGFSSSMGPGSDNESLHSSSSSLECPTPIKGPQNPVRQSESLRIGASQLSSPLLKKFSSHSNVFHTEVDVPIRQGAKATFNHSSLPSLDLHIAEDQGVGPVLCSTPRINPSVVQSAKDKNCVLPLPRFMGKELPILPLEMGQLATGIPPAPASRHTVKLQKFPINLDGLIDRPPEVTLPADPALKALSKVQLQVNLNTSTGLSQQPPEDAVVVTSDASTLPSAGRLPGMVSNKGSTSPQAPFGPVSQPRIAQILSQTSSLRCPATAPFQETPVIPSPREPETLSSTLDQEASKLEAPAPILGPMRDDPLLGANQLLKFSRKEDTRGRDLLREGRWSSCLCEHLAFLHVSHQAHLWSHPLLYRCCRPDL